ncbi:MAG TPA: hypothetical protein VEW04_11425 [Allosphingosinicella sp.]|nr:hypothetical protein [Allosphingosinicella sp.]
MQLRACLGMALLALTACAEIPKGISIVVDGSTLEFKKAPEPAPAEPGPVPAPADDPQR